MWYFNREKILIIFVKKKNKSFLGKKVGGYELKTNKKERF